MKPAAFRYHRPDSLDAALALLARHGDSARPIAGGQSLVPMMNLRMAQPAELIDLARIPDLRQIRRVSGELEIGAMATHHEIETSAAVRTSGPLLSAAAATIGHYAIRQRGTLGGSLAHADPAAQWPLIAVTLQAGIETVSARGRRSLKADHFFQSLMTTALHPDELLLAVRFPCAHPGEGWGFQAFSRRSGDFAIVAAAATLRLVAGRVEHLRLGVGGAGPVPVALSDLASAQRGQLADASWAARVGAAARQALKVADDPRIPALYRQELIEVMVTRALVQAMASGDSR